MECIILKSDDLSWKIEKNIGKGGFGAVYEATSQDDDAKVAIKLIPKSEGARRELLFEDLSEAKNTIKIIATGEYNDKYFIVMDLASLSLRDALNNGSLSTQDSLGAVRDAAEALESIQNSVVHRDIKPDNILLFNDKWCLSDFGIARFIDQTTATETFKRAHSAPYTAPERWRGERASSASDIYSLGITAYEIIEGKLPFRDGDLGEKHQNSPIPPFNDNTDHRVARLISDMLSKSATMRPTPKRVIEVLDTINLQEGNKETVSDELLALQKASKVVSSARQEEEAEAEKRRLSEKARAEFISASKSKLESELNLLKTTLTTNAAEGTIKNDPTRVFYAGPHNWEFSLGNAQITIEPAKGADSSPFDGMTRMPFDTSAYTTISLSISGRIVRSHSIWFSDMINEGDYGCYEVSFMEIFTNNHSHQPFALEPVSAGVDNAFLPIMGGYQLARNPLRIEDNSSSFTSRWVKYFVDAVNGTYQRPTNMPEETITNKTRR